jgi:hypothetical protein
VANGGERRQTTAGRGKPGCRLCTYIGQPSPQVPACLGSSRSGFHHVEPRVEAAISSRVNMDGPRLERRYSLNEDELKHVDEALQVVGNTRVEVTEADVGAGITPPCPKGYHDLM